MSSTIDPAPDGTGLIDDGEVRLRQPAIRPEQHWRTPPSFVARIDGRGPGVILSRWSSLHLDKPLAVCLDAANTHVISFAIKPTTLDFASEDLAVRDHAIAPDTLLLTPPVQVRQSGMYHRQFDFLRAYIPDSLLKECAQAASGKDQPDDIRLFPAHFSKDADLRLLMRSILVANAQSCPLDLLFLEGMGLALASRLLALGQERPAPSHAPLPLGHQQLRLVLDFVDANLGQAILISDLGNLLGLGRMHFSARFRAATGRTPSAFILQRRIARAKDLLIDPSLSVSEIGLSVGFSDQAHFTTMFRKLAGYTPTRWRKARS